MMRRSGTKAKWNGTLFMWSPPGPDVSPPCWDSRTRIPSAAKEIFKSWRTKRYGDDDVKERSQNYTVVRGCISRDSPASYAMMVSQRKSNNVPISDGSIIGFVSRINRMYPNSTQNLDQFLAEYARHGRYVLFPAHLPNQAGAAEPIFGLPIAKHNRPSINAWEITTNDMTASVLDWMNCPYSTDQPNAPFLRRWNG